MALRMTTCRNPIPKPLTAKRLSPAASNTTIGLAGAFAFALNGVLTAFRPPPRRRSGPRRGVTDHPATQRGDHPRSDHPDDVEPRDSRARQSLGIAVVREAAGQGQGGGVT